MSHPVTSVWVEGQGATGVTKIRPATANSTNTIIVASPSGSKTDSKAQVMRFFKAQTVEGYAKEGKILTPKGQLTAIKTEGIPGKTMTPQYIAVPMQIGSATPGKTSQPSILPKQPVQIQSSPMRIMAANMMSSSPRTNIHDNGDWVKKRAMEVLDYEYGDSKRSKKSGGGGGMGGGDKGGKGLRHFSMKVCEKVQKKGTTSYNEVADELVGEFTAATAHGGSPCEQGYDQKNIRRRVYDALNVLMAMNIISKEKKEIKWLGLPTNSAQECQNLELEKSKRLERLRLKNQQLQDLILQQIAFKNLVERNKLLEKKQATPPLNSAIQLPFIIVNTNKKTVIDCSISSDKSEYLFTFDNTFEIHDDIEVLKRMGLAYDLDKGTCTPSNLEKARKMVPKALEPYVIQMAKGGGDLPPGMTLSTATTKSSEAQLAKCFQAGSSGTESRSSAAAVAPIHLSRQSSIGSSSDLLSRPGTSSASEDDYSDSESEPSSPGE